MHAKRLAVAAVLLPLFYVAVVFLPAWFFVLLLLAVSLLALSEFCAMFRAEPALRFAAIAAGAAILLVVFFREALTAHTLALTVLALLAMRLFIKRDPSSALAESAAPIIGLVYIPFLLSFQVKLRLIGPEWILFLYGTVWAADSFAYYIGKGFGKRRLYREVSPNKTVAGAWGSLAGGLAGALLLRSLFIPSLGIARALSLGLVVGALAIVGDLVESMFKRDAGVKDSGGIIPGHGGILDKIDGVLFAGPVLYWIVKGMG